jgi:hypothetical protein
MRLGMRKTIGDPDADNLPEGFTSTVTTTSGMLGSYLSNFNVEVNSFTKVKTPIYFLPNTYLGEYFGSFWYDVLHRQVDCPQQGI